MVTQELMRQVIKLQVGGAKEGREGGAIRGENRNNSEVRVHFSLLTSQASWGGRGSKDGLTRQTHLKRSKMVRYV